jgi:DNA topoisomerase IA
VQRARTVHASDKNPELGAGPRSADRDLAKLIAEVGRGRAATGAEMVGDLHERFFKHAKSKNLCPTTLREHQRITDKELRPGSAHSSS